MTGSCASDADASADHFRTHGWMRVRAAFTGDEAAAMRAVVWQALAAVGIAETEPSTWTIERPEHLQTVKADPAFLAVGSQRVLDAIETPCWMGSVTRSQRAGALPFSRFRQRNHGTSRPVAGTPMRTT